MAMPFYAVGLRNSQTVFLIPNVVRNGPTLSGKRALKIQLSTVIVTLRCPNLALVSFRTKVLRFLFLLSFHFLTLSQYLSLLSPSLSTEKRHFLLFRRNVPLSPRHFPAFLANLVKRFKHFGAPPLHHNIPRTLVSL